MCTSIILNREKTIVGWNLDILDMEYRIRKCPEGVYIEINDAKDGWMPLFGANSRGDFVGWLLVVAVDWMYTILALVMASSIWIYKKALRG